MKLPYLVETQLDQVLPHAPFKLIAIALEDTERLEKLRATLEASELGQEVTCAFSHPQYLEIYSRKAGKGNALQNLCKALHVHIRNSVAAGDEENDISMIEAAAVGVCMANGNPVVKEHADYVTENDNNHDGIAEIIDKYII